MLRNRPMIYAKSLVSGILYITHDVTAEVIPITRNSHPHIIEVAFVHVGGAQNLSFK
jgi:hypothetical protein